MAKEIKTIGVLTSGGDAPGMNAAVRAVVRIALSKGIKVKGIERGYNGLLHNEMRDMDLRSVSEIIHRGGTVLYTARCLEFLTKEGQEQGAQCCRDNGIDALVVVGGDGSFKGARALANLGIPCIGIPGTIDNDLPYTEMTLGFETAVQVCTEAVRSIRATSRSHDRPAVVEVMGRHCGDIALKTACATGAEIVVVPEVPWSVEEVAARLNKLIAKGNTRATIIVAEGCWESMAPFDMYTFLNEHGKKCYEGEPISAVRFASIMKRMCGMVEARATVVGYTQRGAEPVAKDSAFAFEAGNLAVRLLRDGISNQVIGTRQGKVFYMPIADALKAQRPFRRDLYDLVNSL